MRSFYKSLQIAVCLLVLLAVLPTVGIMAAEPTPTVQQVAQRPDLVWGTCLIRATERGLLTVACALHRIWSVTTA